MGNGSRWIDFLKHQKSFIIFLKSTLEIPFFFFSKFTNDDPPPPLVIDSDFDLLYGDYAAQTLYNRFFLLLHILEVNNAIEWQQKSRKGMKNWIFFLFENVIYIKFVYADVVERR